MDSPSVRRTLEVNSLACPPTERRPETIMSEQTIPFQAHLVKKAADGRAPARPTSRVQWIGESDYWAAPECLGEPEFIMPLSEDSVLEVARMQTTARKLSLRAAINCTSRLALRVALATTGLNPGRDPVEWPGPSVVRAPAPWSR